MSTILPRVRLISRESSLLVRLTGLLVEAGFDVSASFDADEALPFIAHAHPPVVLFDDRMSKDEALKVLRRIKALSPETRIVLLTSRSEAVRQGRKDAPVPRRPLEPRVVLRAIERALSAGPAECGV
jgi:DNA-binding NtrC family response regulator